MTNWERGRRLNTLLQVMSLSSYHILYRAMKMAG